MKMADLMLLNIQGEKALSPTTPLSLSLAFNHSDTTIKRNSKKSFVEEKDLLFCLSKLITNDAPLSIIEECVKRLSNNPPIKEETTYKTPKNRILKICL
jgi:hypothetical protein